MNNFRLLSSSSIVIKVALVYIMCLFSMNVGLSQACTICSQADVDNYTGNLGGNIVISGPDITNLDALADNIGSGFVIFGLTIDNNPLLTDISGISQIPPLPNGEVMISDNPLLESISFPILSQVLYYFRVQNNASLDSIYLPELLVQELTIEDNSSLVHIGFSANTSIWETITIDNNSSLENLDGLADFIEDTDILITNNSQLRFYCGLHERILLGPTDNITITGNLKNPTFSEILLEGTCGNYVRGLIGYPTLSEALVDAEEHDFIYVERSNTIDVSTTFLGTQKNTLVIRPQSTLTFTASFTNEGIVINHGKLEMMSGADFNNSGAFVNTGTLISN